MHGCLFASKTGAHATFSACRARAVRSAGGLLRATREDAGVEHARRAVDDLAEDLGRGPDATERADALPGRHARALGIGTVPVRHHVALAGDHELLREAL